MTALFEDIVIVVYIINYLALQAILIFPWNLSALQLGRYVHLAASKGGSVVANLGKFVGAETGVTVFVRQRKMSQGKCDLLRERKMSQENVFLLMDCRV